MEKSTFPLGTSSMMQRGRKGNISTFAQHRVEAPHKARGKKAEPFQCAIAPPETGTLSTASTLVSIFAGRGEEGAFIKRYSPHFPPPQRLAFCGVSADRRDVCTPTRKKSSGANITKSIMRLLAAFGFAYCVSSPARGQTEPTGYPPHYRADTTGGHREDNTRQVPRTAAASGHPA